MYLSSFLLCCAVYLTSFSGLLSILPFYCHLRTTFPMSFLLLRIFSPTCPIPPTSLVPSFSLLSTFFSLSFLPYLLPSTSYIFYLPSTIYLLLLLRYQLHHLSLPSLNLLVSLAFTTCSPYLTVLLSSLPLLLLLACISTHTHTHTHPSSTPSPPPLPIEHLTEGA